MYSTLTRRRATMITDDYEVFCDKYHKGLIKENKKLKEEINELKEKNNGYKALLDCECGVSIERVVEIKNEIKALKKKNKELKKENKELQEFQEQVEDECGASAVCAKMIDEIRDLEEEIQILKETDYDEKIIKSIEEYKKYYDEDGDLIMEENDFYEELSKIIWGSKKKWIGWIECLKSIKRYKSYFVQNKKLRLRILDLKEYVKCKNNLLYENNPDTLEEVNRDVDKNY